jgi:hypothetical protein
LTDTLARTTSPFIVSSFDQTGFLRLSVKGTQLTSAPGTHPIETLRGLDKKDAAIAGSEDQPLDLCKAADKYSCFASESMVFCKFSCSLVFRHFNAGDGNRADKNYD